MNVESDIRRYRRNLRGEIDSAALYRALAAAEPSPELAEVYGRLAAVEDRHANLWRTRLGDAGQHLEPLGPTLRARVLSWLVHRVGAEPVLPLVLAGEAADIHTYENQPEARAAGLTGGGALARARLPRHRRNQPTRLER